MNIDSYIAMPIGSIILLPEKDQRQYLDMYYALPPTIKKILGTARTGAYIKGLARSYDIQSTNVPLLSHIVLRVGCGLEPFARLPFVLSSELKLPQDKAQQMAKELEKDLFSSVALDFNKLTSQKKESTTQLPKAGLSPSNVLDLKGNNRQTPKAPPIPPLRKS